MQVLFDEKDKGEYLGSRYSGQNSDDFWRWGS